MGPEGSLTIHRSLPLHSIPRQLNLARVMSTSTNYRLDMSESY